MPIDKQILARSCASERFKADLIAFNSWSDSPSITMTRNVPRIKVIRLVNQLLHAHPEWAIDRLHIDARSGCSDFTGEMTVYARDAEHRFAFTWCCAWRAEQEGWRDCFGFWDQARAAREFGFRCFSRWEVLAS